jgi:hypothetical protein
MAPVTIGRGGLVLTVSPTAITTGIMAGAAPVASTTIMGATMAGMAITLIVARRTTARWGRAIMA